MHYLAKLRTVGLGSSRVNVAEHLPASGAGQLAGLRVNALAPAAWRYPCVAVFHGGYYAAEFRSKKALCFQCPIFAAKFLTFALCYRLTRGGNQESVMRDALRVRGVTPSTGSNGWIAEVRRTSRYSMTLSARLSRVGGTSSPSAVAVRRLMTSSNLSGCSTGMSAGLTPLKILMICRARCRLS